MALIFGIVYALVGLLGFLTTPTEGDLLGIFYVDTFHNIVHLGAGLLAIAAALGDFARAYFKVFGVIFILLALSGFLFVPDRGSLFNILALNMADHILHLLTAAVFIYFGFIYRRREVEETTPA
jgi:hypothetical protein